MGKFKYGFAFKTDLPLKEIENWLRGNCSGEWDVSLADVDERDTLHVKKKLNMLFEIAEDAKKFQTEFSRHK